ncbi:hypothetical protein JOD43_003129 [Pullulanibacillus pueri]|uniref:Tim44-like domain-containing protein n=1 Tax=Pullulanibacillus pueri TaxID=1437324 RepID=A0A8J2ZYI5_9BACL|nr:TIM44-like domain-containing protein [Pullulanibacillus pueri]MBM7682950.1 hypothetical protein [Pullulanibacillus pueri]GGH84695.1 hypothetical protein GCM10007096_28370 [Pullulanibacillus pueri]
MTKLLLLLVAFFFALSLGSFTTVHHVASAAAGGGSAGSGGGGSGGSGTRGGRGGSPGYVNTPSHQQSSSKTSFITLLLFAGVFVGIAKATGNLRPLGLSSRVQHKPKGLDPEVDAFWRDKKLRSRIDTCYIKIQKAWSKQDPDLAAAYMSEGLLQEHKALIAKMKEDKERNVVALVNVVQVKSIYASPDRQEMRVSITSRMIDYIINTETKKLMSGRKFQKGTLEERWWFVKRHGEWVVDQIFG